MNFADSAKTGNSGTSPHGISGFADLAKTGNSNGISGVAVLWTSILLKPV